MNSPLEFHVTVHSWKNTWVESSYSNVYRAFKNHSNYHRTKSDGVQLDFSDDSQNGAHARKSILEILNTHLDLPWHTMSSISYGRYYPDFKAVFKPTRLLELLLPHVHLSVLANFIVSFLFEPATPSIVREVNHSEPAPLIEASHIQHVMHIEPAAQICPAEAAQITSLQHAGFIERNLGVGPVPEQDEQVKLLQLNRTSSDLVKALAEGPALKQCRAEMQAAHCQSKLASGTFIFVKRWQYQSAMKAAEAYLGLGGLKSSHIIFGESVEYLLEEVLDSVRGGSWAKYQIHLTVESLSGAMSAVSEDDVGSRIEGFDSDNASDQSVVCIVKNTFLCWAPRLHVSGDAGAHSA